MVCGLIFNTSLRTYGGTTLGILYFDRDGMMSFSEANILLHGFSKFIYLSVKKDRN